MRNISKLCVVSVLSLSVLHPAALTAAPLKSSKLLKDLVRQCEYEDGVVLRVLAPRECPVLETEAPMPVTPTLVPSQPVGAVNQQAAQSAKTSDDIVLDKAISRCTNIGYKRETAEFRSCVTEQITLLSK